MATLVEELQSEALNSDGDIADLLRKALLVATKLGVNEMRTWVAQELGGYSCKPEEVPEYRHVRGQVRALNPMRGWIPVQFPSDEFEHSASTFPTFQSISEIEKLAESESPHISYPFPAEQQAFLREIFKVKFLFEIQFSHSTLHGIVDAVRTKILTWSLELESNGVKGES